MIGSQKRLNIIDCWNEIKKLENDLDLYKTLRETNGDISSSQFKSIVVSCGSHKSDTMLMDLIANDQYTAKINEIYKSKLAYENYLVAEIERLSLSSPSYVIVFLKDYQKLSWKKIAYKMNYSVRQCQRYYNEYTKVNMS